MSRNHRVGSLELARNFEKGGMAPALGIEMLACRPLYPWVFLVSCWGFRGWEIRGLRGDFGSMTSAMSEIPPHAQPSGLLCSGLGGC